MKTAPSNVITPFSLLHPLPNRNIYITQLRIRPARLLITSALPAQAAHADNKQWNFKRVHQKKGGEIKIRLRLINNSWLQKFTYDLKVGLTSYSVNVSQEVRQAALQQAQTGKRCHQFFRMQKMARWCNYSLFKSIHFSRFSPRSPAMATRVNMAMLHTGCRACGHFYRTKKKKKQNLNQRWMTVLIFKLGLWIQTYSNPLNQPDMHASSGEKTIPYLLWNLAAAADSYCFTGVIN